MQQSSSGSTPAMVGFIDGFLRESNIKWLLALGAAILLASSLMLVVNHWGDYTPSWKYLIMLLYTAAIYRAGMWVNQRLLLKKTGTALLALTVFLLPALFAVLHWIGIESDVLRYALFALTLVFSVLAADRTFAFFFRSRQLSFLLCYQILCLAYFVLPALPPATLMLQGIALWAVLCIGTAKISRHVFWLSEEHQLARIFGFFPVILLGAQFLGFFALNIAPAMRIEWLGLACVLLAVPILLSADAAARVFDQRTGFLILRRPAAVVLPLLAALLLAVTGVVCSFAGLLPLHSPLAITPTAFLVALIAAVVARRTRLQAFVWAMLTMLTLAYNFAPFYFTELAMRAVSSGAELMQEQKLPFAFYGLTYLPLIAVLTYIASIGRTAGTQAGSRLFWTLPCGRFAIILSCVLLVLSLSHVKAMFLVPIALLPVFIAHTVLFRLPYMALAALAAFVIAAGAGGAFMQAVFDSRGIIAQSWFWLAAAGGVLWLGGGRLDDRLGAMATQRAGYEKTFRAVQISSLLLTIYLAIDALEMRLYADGSLLQGLLVGALLLAHSLRWQSPLLAFPAIVFGYFVAVTELASRGFGFGDIVSLATIALTSQWLLGYALRAYPGQRISRTFAAASSVAVNCALLAMALLLYFPLLLIDLLVFNDWLSELWPWQVCYALMIGWLIDSARLYRRRWLACAGALGVVLWLSNIWLDSAGEQGLVWLPLLWAGLGGLTFAARIKWRHPVIGLAFEQVATAVLFATALLALINYNAEIVAAGLAAAGALHVFARYRQLSGLQMLSIVLLNWQILALIVVFTAPGWLNEFHQLASIQALPVMIPLALGAALSTLFWRHGLTAGTAFARRISRAQFCALTAVAVLAMLQSLQLDTLSFIPALAALAVFAALFWQLFSFACEKKSERLVWLALLILGAGLAYFIAQGWVRFGGGWSLLVLSCAAVCAHFLARYTAAREQFSVSSAPFQQLALALPLVCVALALLRTATGVHTLWLGQNSLALFIAAGFYFFIAYEKRQTWLLIASAAIANLAFALLWFDLDWSDPQFFLVPLGVSVLGLRYLLGSQLPSAFHTPLNYSGALIILVSPLFNIAQGSWLHIFTLMLCAVGVVLTGIGLRVRALLYTGTAFLAAALLSMLVRGAVDQPNLLWVAGLLLGAAVVFLGALAERNRELLLQRVRMLSATLNSWE